MTTADINECAAGMDDCDSNADCTNLPGSYTCTCRDGYEGDGQTCTGIVHKNVGIGFDSVQFLSLLSLPFHT